MYYDLNSVSDQNTWVSFHGHCYWVIFKKLTENLQSTGEYWFEAF